MEKALKRLGFLVAMVVLAGLLVACGGDDDDGTSADVADNGSSASVDSDNIDTPLGDPCELVTAADVEGVLGVEVTTTLSGVDDQLPGSLCIYSGSGVQLNMGYTADGAAFYSANKNAASGVEDVDGVGDEAFLFENTEIQAVSGETLVIVSRMSGDFAMSEEGVELANMLIAALP